LNVALPTSHNYLYNVANKTLVIYAIRENSRFQRVYNNLQLLNITVQRYRYFDNIFSHSFLNLLNFCLFSSFNPVESLGLWSLQDYARNIQAQSYLGLITSRTMVLVRWQC